MMEDREDGPESNYERLSQGGPKANRLPGWLKAFLIVLSSSSLATVTISQSNEEIRSEINQLSSHSWFKACLFLTISLAT